MMEDALSWGGILTRIAAQLLPVWVALIATFALSLQFKRRLGLYGRIFDSPVGMTGFGLVMFWVFTAIFANWIITHDPLAQLSGMKNILPGAAVKDAAEGTYPYYLLGGDHLARRRRGVRGAPREQRAPVARVGERRAERAATGESRLHQANMSLVMLSYQASA
jgi:ABC-type dipeptide/oligopeptide/nickel transport system permease subunit